MLKQIKCNLFRDPIIKFKNGLNVIAGDSLASNSIGKSTMLMIIDFAFGGSSYLTRDFDAVEALGQHTFYFTFEFDGKEFYFSRSTSRDKFVSRCDSQFNSFNEVKLSEYTKLLKKLYKLNSSDSSFRDIVSLYSRIWGKKNYDIDRPLQISGEKAFDAIQRFIKLCGKYNLIEKLEEQIKELESEKSAINAAAKKDFLPSINKSEYKEYIARIEKISREIEQISRDLEGTRANREAIISSEILELRNARSVLIEQRNVCANRLKHTKSNLLYGNPAVRSKLEKLTEFFPEINKERLLEVDNFHLSISKYLKISLQKTVKELQAQLNYLESEIQKLDMEITSKLNLTDTPKYTVERLLELGTTESKLTKAIEIFDKKKSIEDDLAKAKSDLSDIKSKVLAKINSMINIKMNDLNSLINPDGRKSPILQIEEKKYIFAVPNDTGAGKAYSSLITLDLAVLTETELPFIIHDTMLFKNIENVVFENIVLIYSAQTKQVFIAVDEIQKFNTETSNILNNNTVLKLSCDHTLFIKDWKKYNNVNDKGEQ